MTVIYDTRWYAEGYLVNDIGNVEMFDSIYEAQRYLEDGDWDIGSNKFKFERVNRDRFEPLR